jgi:hypothetical protein
MSWTRNISGRPALEKKKFLILEVSTPIVLHYCKVVSEGTS